MSKRDPDENPFGFRTQDQMPKADKDPNPWPNGDGPPWPKPSYIIAPAQLIAIATVQQPPLPDRLVALDKDGVLWVLNNWKTWDRVETEPRPGKESM